MLGSNDSVQKPDPLHVSIDDYKANLHAIVANLRQRTRPPLHFLAMPTTPPLPPLSPLHHSTTPLHHPHHHSTITHHHHSGTRPPSSSCSRRPVRWRGVQEVVRIASSQATAQAKPSPSHSPSHSLQPAAKQSHSPKQAAAKPPSQAAQPSQVSADSHSQALPCACLPPPDRCTTTNVSKLRVDGSGRGEERLKGYCEAVRDVALSPRTSQAKPVLVDVHDAIIAKATAAGHPSATHFGAALFDGLHLNKTGQRYV